MGANVGAASARRRLGLIANRWHRREAELLTRVALEVADDTLQPSLESMLALFEHTGPSSRVALARQAGELRRRPRDQAIMRTLITVGIW